MVWANQSWFAQKNCPGFKTDSPVSLETLSPGQIMTAGRPKRQVTSPAALCLPPPPCEALCTSLHPPPWLRLHTIHALLSVSPCFQIHSFHPFPLSISSSLVAKEIPSHFPFLSFCFLSNVKICPIGKAREFQKNIYFCFID